MQIVKQFHLILFHPLKAFDIMMWKWTNFLVKKDIYKRAKKKDIHHFDKRHYAWMTISDDFYYDLFCIQESNLLKFLKDNYSDNVEKIVELGAASDLFLNEVNAEHKVGINILPECIENLKRKNIEARLSDGKGIPAKDNEPDAVICYETLEHVPAPITFMRELERIVKPGGNVFISIPWVKKSRILGRYHNGFAKDRPESENHIFEFSPEDFRKVLTYTNFEIKEYSLLRNYSISYDSITNYFLKKYFVHSYFPAIQAYVLKKGQ